MDHIDRKILSLLQGDAGLPVQEIADQVNLSATPTARRIRQLRDSGVIRQEVALLDPEKLGLGVTMFVFLQASEHDDRWLKTFSEGVARMPEVVEFYRMSGDVDYLLKVLVSSLQDYNDFYERLIRVAPLKDVSSSFAMEKIKNTTELPIPP